MWKNLQNFRDWTLNLIKLLTIFFSNFRFKFFGILLITDDGQDDYEKGNDENMEDPKQELNTRPQNSEQ